jgi:peptidoglycan hydrolase-like protein with peptidoglycan-binding domain
VNAVAGQTVANLVTVGLGGGSVSLYSLAGPTHVVVDVTGWYGNGFHPLQPSRVLDTRDGTGGPAGALAGGVRRDLVLGGAGGVPGGAVAVALNVTAVNPSAAGFLTVWPAGAAQPLASNLNVVPGQTVPNVVLVGLGTGGAVSIAVSSGLADVVVDVTGWWSAGFHPIVPARIVDTRAGQCLTRLGPGETRAVGVVGNAGVPAAAAAVALNVTLVNPTAPTYLTVWPAGQPRPASSSVNGRVGVVPNLVTVGVGADGRVDLFNAAGTVDVVVDVAGWFDGAGPGALVTGCDVVTPPSAAGALVTDPSPLPTVTIPALGRGGSRDEVLALQSRLQDLGFWAGIPDGTYGQVTSQAVMAFQKYLGLAPSGVVDELTALLLSMQGLRPFAESRSGDLIEVDKGRQLLFVIRGGQVLWTVNTSTGSDIPYNEPDQKTGGRATGTAHTPEGRFKVYTEHSDGWELGELGQLYRPKFFIGGVAVHGAPQIPNYPASHGCVRVTTSFMDYVWAANLMPMGSAVWVH